VPVAQGIPTDWTLRIAGGNPVRAQCSVVLGIPEAGRVSLAVYDVRGRDIGNIISGHLTQGYHSLTWTGNGASGTRLVPGVYFLRLDCGEAARTAKVVIAR
jgi:flagellar hook assembly protein FlgD